MTGRLSGVMPLAFCALAALAACGEQSTTPSLDQSAFDLPADQIALVATSHLTHDGIRRASLTADTTFIFEKQRRWEFRNVRVTFFDEMGRESGTLTSRTADYDLRANLFIAREDAVLVSSGPNGERRLETDELHFDVGADRLWSDTAFTLHEGGTVKYGTSFRSDSKFSTWEVTGIRTGGPVGGEGGLTF